MAKNSGFTVMAQIATLNTTDKFPVADQKDIKGGYHTVATVEDMNNITKKRRSEGMLVYVTGTNETYRYVTDSAGTKKFVKLTDTDSTYLKKEDADASYLKKTDADTTYQKKIEVEVTNDSLKTSLEPYLEKNEAQSTYAKIASLTDFVEKTTAENTYAKKSDLENVSSINAYVEGSSHKQGEIVSYNGGLYVALVDTTEAPTNQDAYQQLGKNYVDTSVNNLKTELTQLSDTVHKLPEFAILVVDALPTENISNTTVYLVRNASGTGTNIYDEYIYVNSTWELLGTANVDMSTYLTKDDAGKTYVTNDVLTAKLTENLANYLQKTDAENTYLKKADGLGPDSILTAEQAQAGAATSEKSVYSSFAAESMFAKKSDLTKVSGLLVDNWDPTSQVLTLSLNIGNE